MKQEAQDAGYTFPYLFDQSQAVAKAYRAACTPDSNLVLLARLGSVAYCFQDFGSAYFGGNLPRLLQVKQAYDPHNFFTFPQGLGEAGR